MTDSRKTANQQKRKEKELILAKLWRLPDKREFVRNTSRTVARKLNFFVKVAGKTKSMCRI